LNLVVGYVINLVSVGALHDDSFVEIMANSYRVEIENPNGQNFELWKLKMEDLMVDNEQWVVVNPRTKSIAMLQEDWKKVDKKARSTIQLCPLGSVLLNVSGEDTKKKLRDKLGNLYQSKPLMNKLFLRKKLYHLRMEDGESVTEHLNVFITQVSQLASVEIKMAK